ncbi:MAG: hypothetical protein KAT25_11295 [Sulfuriflexus sp.]|nr:hypothetical protein [Sulfuriflexus sp.]
MAHSVKWESNGVCWKYSGDISGKEIVNACVSIYGDPRFDELKYKLVDFSDAQAINITDADLAQIAFQDKAAGLTNPYIKSAIITTAAVDLAEKFASFFTDSSWDVQVFQDIDLANKWLGREVV